MTIFRLEQGDWVKGKTWDGELIRGFIETIDSIQRIVRVHVVESDNVRKIGKTIATLDKWVEKLPVSTSVSEEQIYQLIDLALLTKDEEWFHALNKQLDSIKKDADEKSKKMNHSLISNNRIGKFDARG